ncbi:MAG: succinate dehydrogenase flavoprotein subunit, partial [bacterium]
MAEKTRIAVVGGGLAGLMATIKIAELGVGVDLFSIVPVKRSHSVCAQGGINGAVNTKGEGDSPEIHFYDTVKGGDFLAHQPLAKGMCYAAPNVIYLLDRMGVPFNRTAEGLLDFRRFGGTLYNRTAFAGASTGQQMLYALDEQVRRYEAEGLVKKYEYWEFLCAVINESGVCDGFVALDLQTMKCETFAEGAVILATGGPGRVYGLSTNSMINTGAAAISVYTQGVKYANGEFIQIHPTAIPGADKHRLMSESARSEGGRVWVSRKKGDSRDPKSLPAAERYYFLEEKYPRFGNLVPRDVASREIYDVCIKEGRGIEGKAMVYLDLTEKSREFLDQKLGAILDIYEKFVGDDPHTTPMKIFPAVHYSMGGLWADFARTEDGFVELGNPRNQMTNVAGLYAIGEVDYQYHGANRLGATSLLSCLYAGDICGPSAVNYLKTRKVEPTTSAAPFARERERWEERLEKIRNMRGAENPYKLHQELGELMIANVLIVRENKRLDETYAKLLEIRERWSNCGCPDTTGWSNQTVPFMNQLWMMIELALVITKG